MDINSVYTCEVLAQLTPRGKSYSVLTPGGRKLVVISDAPLQVGLTYGLRCVGYLEGRPPRVYRVEVV